MRERALAHAASWCAVLVGLAFNTKTLAAYLVVPGIALAYLALRAGRGRLRRIAQLLVAGAVMLAVSFSWIALRRTHARLPATLRRRLDEQHRARADVRLQRLRTRRRRGRRSRSDSQRQRRRSPCATPPGAPRAPPSRRPRRPETLAAAGGAPKPPPAPLEFLPDGRERNPIPFGGPVGPLRLFGVGLGDQGAWMLPFALHRRCSRRALVVLGPGPAPARSDGLAPRCSCSAAGSSSRPCVLSLSKGIVHPYYVSALGPGLAAMAGAGVVAFAALARGALHDWRGCSRPLAVVRDGRRAARAPAPRALPAVARPGADHAARPSRLARCCRCAGSRPARSRSRSRAAARRADRLRDDHLARSRRGDVPGGRAQTGRRRRQARRRHSRRTRDRPRAARLRAGSPAGIALGAADRRLEHRLAVHPARARRRRAGRLQRHRPAAQTAPSWRAWSRAARRATCCSAASSPRAAATPPRWRSSAPASSVPPAAWQGSPRVYADGLVLFDCAGRDRASSPPS